MPARRAPDPLADHLAGGLQRLGATWATNRDVHGREFSASPDPSRRPRRRGSRRINNSSRSQVVCKGCRGAPVPDAHGFAGRASTLPSILPEMGAPVLNSGGGNPARPRARSRSSLRGESGFRSAGRRRGEEQEQGRAEGKGQKIEARQPLPLASALFLFLFLFLDSRPSPLDRFLTLARVAVDAPIAAT